MRYEITVDGYNFHGPIYVQFDPPTKCPMCHASIDPLFLHGYVVGRDDSAMLYVSFLCLACKKVFIASYNLISNQGILHDVYPGFPDKIHFQKNISDLSPKFVEIYNQAAAAETYGLNEVCGIGYRKALEFLVKDYAVHMHPDKEPDIKSEFLSRVIAKYIDDDRIKTIAERAAWLGNDATHYIRVFSGYDLETLKKFIDAIVSLIDSNIVFEEASAIAHK